MEINEFEIIQRLFENAHKDSAKFPHTTLYNEGWMLRLLLAIQEGGKECFPFSFHPRARWFSEAQLNSPFLPRWRSGDKLAEKHTHPDGTVGHFEFRSGTKTGLTLTKDSTQFVVFEAKIFSYLQEKVTNAKGYDQAARTVACMAWTIYESNRSVDDFESLGFYVIAPEERITKKTFTSKMEKTSIKERVNRRVRSYSKDEEKYKELQKWYEGFFIPTLDRIDRVCISWDSIIGKIGSSSIQNFYERCCIFNAPARKE